MIKKSQQTIDYSQSLMPIAKSRSKSLVSELIDPTDFEKTNFFFLKSKHLFREFKNHEYFESQRCQQETQDINRSTQFVEFPPPYGINNAFCFIRDEMSKNYFKKNHHNQFKNINSFNPRYHERQKTKKQLIDRHKRRSINFTLPNLNELPSQSIIKPLEKLRSSQETELRQTGAPLQSSRNIRFSEASKQPARLNFDQYNIDVIYINKFQSLEKFGNIEVSVNIYEYIIKTFLKTKINYLELSSQQFHFILNKIVEIYETEKEVMSYKDIINCKNVQQIFDVLMLYNQNSKQFRQTVRYFFIANQEVYTYQFDCIKDEIRFLINQQTNSINNNEKIFVYDVKSGTLIKHLLELVKHNKNKFIAGVTENTYELYRIYDKEKNSKRDAEKRIQKWKSIVPNQTRSETQFHNISQEKYQTLFNNAQKKRVVLFKSKKKPSISIKSRSFIERDKLVKYQNIFQ